MSCGCLNRIPSAPASPSTLAHAAEHATFPHCARNGLHLELTLQNILWTGEPRLEWKLHTFWKMWMSSTARMGPFTKLPPVFPNIRETFLCSLLVCEEEEHSGILQYFTYWRKCKIKIIGKVLIGKIGTLLFFSNCQTGLSTGSEPHGSRVSEGCPGVGQPCMARSSSAMKKDSHPSLEMQLCLI